MVYSPIFETLHDETGPVGRLGRGTHYSVLRAATWHDSHFHPLPKAELLDFAVIWDEDHDARVIKVVETLYFDGLLAPVRFIGERKGGLTVLVAVETAAAWDLPHYSERVEDAVGRSGLDDWWNVAVDYVGGDSSIICAEPEKVAVYLQDIENLWSLGTKPRPQQERIADALDGESLERPNPPAEQFCRPLGADEISSSCRSWRGDDEKGSYKHHGAVSLNESPPILNCAGESLRFQRRGSSGTIVSTLTGCYRKVTSDAIQNLGTSGCNLFMRGTASTSSTARGRGCVWVPLSLRINPPEGSNPRPSRFTCPRSHGRRCLGERWLPDGSASSCPAPALARAGEQRPSVAAPWLVRRFAIERASWKASRTGRPRGRP